MIVPPKGFQDFFNLGNLYLSSTFEQKRTFWLKIDPQAGYDLRRISLRDPHVNVKEGAFLAARFVLEIFQSYSHFKMNLTCEFASRLSRSMDHEPERSVLIDLYNRALQQPRRSFISQEDINWHEIPHKEKNWDVCFKVMDSGTLVPAHRQLLTLFSEPFKKLLEQGSWKEDCTKEAICIYEVSKKTFLDVMNVVYKRSYPTDLKDLVLLGIYADQMGLDYMVEHVAEGLRDASPAEIVEMISFPLPQALEKVVNTKIAPCMRECDFEKFSTDQLLEILKRDDLAMDEEELYSKLNSLEDVDPRLFDCVRFENMSKDVFLDKVFMGTRLCDSDKILYLKKILEHDSSRSHRGDVFTFEQKNEREAEVKWRIFLDMKELKFANNKKIIRTSNTFIMFNQKCYLSFCEKDDDHGPYHIFFLYIMEDRNYVTISYKMEIGSINPLTYEEKYTWEKDQGWGKKLCPKRGNPSLVHFWNPNGYLDIKMTLKLQNPSSEEKK